MYFLRSRLLHCTFLLLCTALLVLGIGSQAGGAIFAAGLGAAGGNGLYLYRRGALAAYAQSFTVLVDGQPVGSIANASYLRLSLAPGRHRLQIAPGGMAQVTTLQVEAPMDGPAFYEYVFPTGWQMRPSFHGAAIKERAVPLALDAMQGLRRMGLQRVAD
jgi:hypothetical protein